MKAKAKKINLAEHVLVPKHLKLSEKDKKEVFEKFNISIKELPKMKNTDPAIMHLKAEPGDVIKILRHSGTAGEASFYRGVIDG